MKKMEKMEEKFPGRPEVHSPDQLMLWSTTVLTRLLANILPEFRNAPQEEINAAIQPNPFFRSVASYGPFCSERFRIIQEIRFNVLHTGPLARVPNVLRMADSDPKLSRVVMLRTKVPGTEELEPWLVDCCHSVDVDLIRDSWLKEERETGRLYYGTAVIWILEDAVDSLAGQARIRYSAIPRSWPEDRIGELSWLLDYYLFLTYRHASMAGSIRLYAIKLLSWFVSERLPFNV